jgi:hypothetical protein
VCFGGGVAVSGRRESRNVDGMRPKFDCGGRGSVRAGLLSVSDSSTAATERRPPKKKARRREASGLSNAEVTNAAAQAPPAVLLLFGLKAWRKVAPM